MHLSPVYFWWFIASISQLVICYQDITNINQVITVFRYVIYNNTVLDLQALVILGQALISVVTPEVQVTHK